MGVPVETTTNANTTKTVKSSTDKAFVVPANLDITLNTTVDNLKYDQLDIQNLSGQLQVKDEAVKLTNVNGNALGGTMKINGLYSTKENMNAIARGKIGANKLKQL